MREYHGYQSSGIRLPVTPTINLIIAVAIRDKAFRGSRSKSGLLALCGLPLRRLKPRARCDAFPTIEVVCARTGRSKLPTIEDALGCYVRVREVAA